MAVSLFTAVAVAASFSTAASATTAELDPSVELFEEIAPAGVAAAMDDQSLSRSYGDSSSATVDESGVTIRSSAGDVDISATSQNAHVDFQPILMQDGSGLLAIIINDRAAGTEFAMDLSLPDGATSAINESGSVSFWAEDGEFLGGVASPWARDSDGKDVPTYFSIAGSTLTQHVSLDAVEDIKYPVVADPWAGKALVAAAWVTNQGGTKYVVNAVPTSWGEFYRGVDTFDAHIAELKTKLGTQQSKVTSTIRNQFICHVAHGWLGGGATYNMESWRPDVAWWVQGNPVTQCNP